jgi:hypothetical protein
MATTPAAVQRRLRADDRVRLGHLTDAGGIPDTDLFLTKRLWDAMVGRLGVHVEGNGLAREITFDLPTRRMTPAQRAMMPVDVRAVPTLAVRRRRRRGDA